MKSQIDQEEDTCDNPCTCTVLLGKGHHMTRDLQPQRDIDRERERETEFASYPSYIFLLFFTRTEPFSTQTLLHRSCYTQTHLHTDAFTHRSVYTQTLLHAPGTESNTICEYSFVERHVRINSCLTESCADRLFLISPLRRLIFFSPDFAFP